MFFKNDIIVSLLSFFLLVVLSGCGESNYNNKNISEINSMPYVNTETNNKAEILVGHKTIVPFNKIDGMDMDIHKDYVKYISFDKKINVIYRNSYILCGDKETVKVWKAYFSEPSLKDVNENYIKDGDKIYHVLTYKKNDKNGLFIEVLQNIGDTTYLSIKIESEDESINISDTINRFLI